MPQRLPLVSAKIDVDVQRIVEVVTERVSHPNVRCAVQNMITGPRRDRARLEQVATGVGHCRGAGVLTQLIIGSIIKESRVANQNDVVIGIKDSLGLCGDASTLGLDLLPHQAPARMARGMGDATRVQGCRNLSFIVQVVVLNDVGGVGFRRCDTS